MLCTWLKGKVVICTWIGASRQLQLSRQCQSCCISMKDIIYDYMLALAAVLAYLQSIWWSVLLFGCFPCQIHGACSGPLQSQGATNDSSAPRCAYSFVFFPLPPSVKGGGAPMAPTTARTTRVRRVWLVCVVGGGLFGPPPVPIPPTLGGLGRKKAFGFVASFLLQQRGLCILVVASLFKYTYAIAYMYIYLYAQTLTCPNVFESLHAGRNHFFPTDGCFSYVFLVSHQSWLGWWKGQNVERILAGPYPAAGASMF